MDEDTEQIKEWVKNGRCELCGSNLTIKDSADLGRIVLCTQCPLMMAYSVYDERVKMLLGELNFGLARDQFGFYTWIA